MMTLDDDGFLSYLLVGKTAAFKLVDGTSSGAS
jgi:hypothetical protein